MKGFRLRLTYANIVATLALFLVLAGGSAFAASQLAKNSVGSKQIKKNAVTTAKIKNGAVTGSKIKTSSLGTVPEAKDAETLGGAPAAAFLAHDGVAVYGEATGRTGEFTSIQFTTLASKSFPVPSAGFLMVTGSVATEDSVSLAGPALLLFRLTLDGSPLDPNEFAHGISTNFSEHIAEGSGSTTIVVPVNAGSHTVALQAREAESGDYIESSEVSALFVPTGSAPHIPVE